MFIKLNKLKFHLMLNFLATRWHIYKEFHFLFDEAIKTIIERKMLDSWALLSRAIFPDV